jgi:hypothetical protein
VAPADSVWRYNRAPNPGDLEQGWKLHVSATVLNANEALTKVAPLLTGCGVQFKAPSTLQELARINSGLQHGYSQVGKFITVYPRTTAEAVSLAGKLHELTCRMPAPAVPFDRQFRPGSNVFYRYGAFRLLEMEQPGGARAAALRDPQGNLVPDLRESEAAKPDWVQDPFTNGERLPELAPGESPLKTTYRAFRALTQRGKGGVYQAVDLSAYPPRFCILKEGRKHGELSWDGRDGYWRVAHEERVLAHLSAAGVKAPSVYASFDLDGNRYLATEFIEGESLQSLLNRQRRRFSVPRALRYGGEMAAILHAIHSSGWVWRDCKPANFMVTREGRLRPLDFEGACPADRPDPLPWSTPAFVPPEHLAANETRSSVFDDLYSLGAVIYLLLTGRLPEAASPAPVARLRRGVPVQVRELVETLLTAAPRNRPDALAVVRELQASPAG